MNNRPLIIGTWVLSLAGAFGLGLKFRTTPPSSELNGQSEASSLMPAQRSNRTRPAETLRADEAFLANYLRDGQISSADMKSAMEKLTKENDPLKRAALFAALLEKLTPENAKDAFLALKDSRTGRRAAGGRGGRGGTARGGNNEMGMLLNAWGRVDGEGAIAELTAQQEASAESGETGRRGGGGPGGRGGTSGDGGAADFMSAITGWATTDVDAAATYIDSIDDERRSQMYTAGLLQGVMVNGAEEAMQFISAMPEDNEMRGRYTAMVATEMLEQGVDSARAWADGLSDPSLKSGALSTVASEYASQDLNAAVSWVTDYAGEDYGSRAVTEVAETWAESDPRAVLEWAGNLPESAQAGAIAEALDEWTERDPMAASEYLRDMPASEAKDNAIEGFATELAREDPTAAIAWAETIGDQELRLETLTEVAQSWYRRDQTEAANWLEASELPQEMQQAVQEAQSGRGGRGR